MESLFLMNPAGGGGKWKSNRRRRRGVHRDCSETVIDSIMAMLMRVQSHPEFMRIPLGLLLLLLVDKDVAEERHKKVTFPL